MFFSCVYLLLKTRNRKSLSETLVKWSQASLYQDKFKTPPSKVIFLLLILYHKLCYLIFKDCLTN